MDQKSKKEGNAKTNKIVGRSSNASILQRKMICEELRKNNPCKSKCEFREMLKTEYARQNIPIPTDQTINSNLKKWGIDFKNPKHIRIEHTNFHLLGEEIHKKIRQIRVCFPTHNFILFDYEKDSIMEYKPFKELGLRYENINDFLPKLSELDKKQILPDTLCYLQIILKEKGLGEYIANIFDSNFISPKPFLYSEIHDYCTVIVFEYKNYKDIMNNAYCIVEDFVCSASRKTTKR